ncbi:MAG: SPFH domain-containing protein [Oscillospiraceae bacterium]|nr:SPFH domain-containing protein [Oscillospiraceae bacterium]
MGLIQMIKGAVTTNLQDQVKDYFRCDGMTQDHLCVAATKVMRGNVVNNASDAVITNGSLFDVAIGQAAVLVENGKVHDFVYADSNDLAGQYKYDSAVEPSLLGGGLKDIWPSIKNMASRFTAGGQSTNTMRLVYINCKPLLNNPIGFGNIPFRDGEMNLSLNAMAHGTYEFKISNPVAFYENVMMDPSRTLTRTSGDGAQLISAMKKEMKPKFTKALTKISAQRIPYDQLGAYPDELAAAMNEELRDVWLEKRGIEMTTLALELNVDDASKERIAKFQEAATAQNQGLLYSMDRMSINAAREAAANNAGGAAVGFMGMNMAGGGMGAPMQDPMAYQQQMYMQQQQMGMQGGYQQPQSPMQQMPQQMMNAGVAQAPQQAAPAPTAPAADSWTCECGATNTSKFCMECGKSKPAPAPAADGWTCSCGAVNKGKFCMECGAKKPAAEPLYKCDKCGWEPADPKNPPKFCPQCGDPFNDSDIQG